MATTRARLDAIVELVGQGEADVLDLARRFAVSASTIRRDLQRLEAAQAIRRTYGGAIIRPAEAEATLDERAGLNREAKAAIGRAASRFIEDGDTLILDGGSTVAALGCCLKGRRLKVITTNLALMPMLAGEAGIELVLLGGEVRPQSMSTLGPLAEDALRRLTATAAFLGADGVVAGRGLCEASLQQVALKELMMAQAARTVVLADHSKLGQARAAAWAALPPLWTLVTDNAAEAAQRHLMRGCGANLVVAG